MTFFLTQLFLQNLSYITEESCVVYIMFCKLDEVYRSIVFPSRCNELRRAAGIDRII